jgi:hypothetical protein
LVIFDHPERGKVTLESVPLYGLERAAGLPNVIPDEGPVVEFELFDDDGNSLYGGTLTNDGEAINQIAALRYGETDEGATVIKVKINDEWVQEIS